LGELAHWHDGAITSRNLPQTACNDFQLTARKTSAVDRLILWVRSIEVDVSDFMTADRRRMGIFHFAQSAA